MSNTGPAEAASLTVNGAAHRSVPLVATSVSGSRLAASSATLPTVRAAPSTEYLLRGPSSVVGRCRSE